MTYLNNERHLTKKKLLLLITHYLPKRKTTTEYLMIASFCFLNIKM